MKDRPVIRRRAPDGTGEVQTPRRAAGSDAEDGDGSEQRTESAEPARLAAQRTNEPTEGESFGTEFLDNLAHQLIAPIQAVERLCDNIVEGRVEGEEAKLRLKEVIGHTRILAELARRMRFLHQLVEGRSIGHEQLPFEAVVTVWIDAFNNYLYLLRGRGIEAEIDHLWMNKLPDVSASRLAVHQVAMNLFDNAAKYAKPGTDIRVFAEERDGFILNTFQHVAQVVLTAGASQHIFTRGFRADEARNARAAGTGLGMSLSRDLMRAMGGDLQAYPTNKKGITKFVLKWKVAQ